MASPGRATDIPAMAPLAGRMPLHGHPLWQMALASALFSLMGAAAHGTRAVWPWPVVAFARCAVMALVVTAVAWRGGVPVLFPRGGGAVWARGVFGGLALLCTFYSLSRLTVAETVVIFALSPLWITLIAGLLERRPPSAAQGALLAIALAGTGIMHRPGFNTPLFALLVALTGSVLVAVAMVSLSRTGGHHPLSVVTHFSLTATLISGAAVAVVAGNPASWRLEHPAGALGALLLVGITGTGGQLFMTAAYQTGRPGPVALVGLSQMVWAALLDAALFRQPPDLWGWVGMAIISAALGARLIWRESPPRPVPPVPGAG